MSITVLVPVLIASLIGSLHCVGMCGGFVAIYSAGSRSALPHLAYHAGRLATYLALGAIAGALGAALDLAGRAAGIGRVAGVVAGGLMVLWALALLLESAGIAARSSWSTGARARIVRLLARFAEKPPLARAALLGLSSTLLPCGWLYAFAVAAAGTGSALGGTLVMAAFWIGTVPLLLGLGVGVQSLAPRLRRHVPVLSAFALLVVGMSALIGRWNLPALAAHACCHH